MNHPVKIGCHLSIAKGFEATVKNALRLEAEAFQFFSKNPRAFKSKKVDLADAEKGVALMRQHGLAAIAHSPYITNLSTPKPDLQELTVRSLVEDLTICDAYGTPGLVVHSGKHVEMGESFGLGRMVETLNLILAAYQGPCQILLENTAGQGSEIGTTLEQLVETRARTEAPERIGFCFDTCHGFAAGLWSGDGLQEFLKAGRETGYFEHLRAIHLNDSKGPFGNRRDRHELIGKGEIGAAALGAFLRTPEFQTLPVLLETPVEDQDEYGPEMAYVRELCRGK
ncbi:MAG: deoxyribonuclease IV [Symbiobacteriia bacterium]